MAAPVATIARRDAMIDRPTLLHVCYGGTGGHHAVVTTLAAELGPLGIDTSVVALAPQDDLIDDVAAWPGVARLRPVPLRRRADLASMSDTLHAIQHARPRAVLVHSHRHVVPAFVARASRGGPERVVTVEHATHAGRYPLATANLATAAALSSAVVYLSEESRDASPIAGLPLRGLDHCVVIPNGVAAAPLRAVRSPRAGTVGTATRLVTGKDVVGLVEAVGILVERGHDVRLRVAGDGPDRDAIARTVVRLGLQDRVELCGALPSSAMPDFYGSLAAYVQPTDGETLSMAMLEAAAAGVPLVASAVTGIVGTFDDAAILVPPRDPGAMADGIGLALVRGPVVDAQVAAATRLVDERFSAGRMARAYLALLAEVDPAGPWREVSGDLGA